MSRCRYHQMHLLYRPVVLLVSSILWQISVLQHEKQTAPSNQGKKNSAFPQNPQFSSWKYWQRQVLHPTALPLTTYGGHQVGTPYPPCIVKKLQQWHFWFYWGAGGDDPQLPFLVYKKSCRFPRSIGSRKIPVALIGEIASLYCYVHMRCG